MPSVEKPDPVRTSPPETPGTPHAARPARTQAERWWVERLARRFPIVDVIREDRHVNGGLSEPGCRAVVLHRLANWATTDEAPALARRPVRWLAEAGLRHCRLAYGIELPSSTTLGRRVRIGHQSGIVVSRDAVIDDDVLIRQNVTIGRRGDEDAGNPDAVPHLRRGVTVGAGAVLVGPIEVGEGAMIGANAVVTRDVPAGGKAVAPSTQIYAPAR